MNKGVKSIFILSVIAIVAVVNSCKKDEYVESRTNYDSNYYPVDIGYWIEYQADSIVHLDNDDINQVDTSIDEYHFFIREEVDSVIIDGENDTAYVISRYKRTADTLPWEFTALWTSKLTSHALERVEDNRRYIRLAFPFNPLSRWNGNAYNELPEEEYSYEELYEAGSFSGLNFDSTITVNQNEFISNINRVIRKEIYGNHVGLLYKRSDSVGVAYTSQGIVILSGVEYEQTVIDYKQ